MAERHLVRGKVREAIEAYRSLYEEYPSEIAYLNTAGDLWVKLGRSYEAIECFDRAAKAYQEAGFILKAIAVLRKVQALAPQNLEVVERLAELYARQGMKAEARDCYEQLAEAWMKRGKLEDALPAYEKIAQLDPADANSQYHLAEIYSGKGLRQKARDCYVRAGESFAARDNLEDALRALRQALEIDPFNKAALSGLLRALCKGSKAAEALPLLERAEHRAQGDPDYLEMLCKAYLAAGRPREAEEKLEELLSVNSSRFELSDDLAEFYLSQHDFTSAVRVIQKAAVSLISFRREERAVSILNRILAHAPENLEALMLLLDICFKTNNQQEYITSLARLADIYIEHREYLKALEILERLIAADFRNPLFREKHVALHKLAFPDKPYVPPVIFDEEPLPAPATFQLVPQPQPEPAPTESTVDLSAELSTIFSQPAETAQPEVESDFAVRLTEIDFNIKVGLYDEAQRMIEALESERPGAPELAERRRQIGAEVKAVEMVAETQQSTGEFLGENAGAEAQTSTSGPLADLLQEVGEIKPEGSDQAIVAYGVDAEDFRSHFDLGIGYKEMGLLDKAIASLQTAYKIARSKDLHGEAARCCAVIGSCFMERELPEAAVKWYRLGLECPGLGEEEYKALHYELGLAYESCGEADKALESLLAVYEIDVAYRAVAAKIERLRRQLNR